MPLIDILGWIFFGIVVCCIAAGAIIFVKKVTLYPEKGVKPNMQAVRDILRRYGNFKDGYDGDLDELDIDEALAEIGKVLVSI